MLLSGGIGAGGAVAYTHYTAPPPLDLSPLHNDLVSLLDQTRQANNALLASLSSQNAALANMNVIMQRAESERLAAQARAQAQIEQYHAGFNRTINSIPTK